jgi:hypothetical protein
MAALIAIGVYAIRHRPVSSPAQAQAAPEAMRAPRTAETVAAERPNYHCDGRTRCPQMTSCEEATFFLRNCPGAKMDGDQDGVPCEDRWCRN